MKSQRAKKENFLVAIKKDQKKQQQLLMELDIARKEIWTLIKKQQQRRAKAI